MQFRDYLIDNIIFGFFQGLYMSSKLLVATVFSVGAFITNEADASLTSLNTWIGNVGYSSDGFGSTSQAGEISAYVPAGSTVLVAYLYTATFDNPSISFSGSLAGVAVTYDNIGVNAGTCCDLSAGRVDVTNILAPIINVGSGGQYDFAITEDDASQDGEALVVVYENLGIPESTFAILDGFASVTGDTTSLNFSEALDPSSPSFYAEMFLGISFSCCDDQKSVVSVNSILATENAGNNDDGLGGVSEGQLITVGGFNDPFSPLLPSYVDDHEKYNLKQFISSGDKSISIKTANASQDDNIFLAGFYAKGRAGLNTSLPTPPSTVPEPSILFLIASGLAGFSFSHRHKK